MAIHLFLFSSHNTRLLGVIIFAMLFCYYYMLNHTLTIASKTNLVYFVSNQMQLTLLALGTF